MRHVSGEAHSEWALFLCSSTSSRTGARSLPGYATHDWYASDAPPAWRVLNDYAIADQKRKESLSGREGSLSVGMDWVATLHVRTQGQPSNGGHWRISRQFKSKRAVMTKRVAL